MWSTPPRSRLARDFTDICMTQRVTKGKEESFCSKAKFQLLPSGTEQVNFLFVLEWPVCPYRQSPTCRIINVPPEIPTIGARIFKRQNKLQQFYIPCIFFHCYRLHFLGLETKPLRCSVKYQAPVFPAGGACVASSALGPATALPSLNPEGLWWQQQESSSEEGTEQERPSFSGRLRTELPKHSLYTCFTVQRSLGGFQAFSGKVGAGRVRKACLPTVSGLYFMTSVAQKFKIPRGEKQWTQIVRVFQFHSWSLCSLAEIFTLCHPSHHLSLSLKTRIKFFLFLGVEWRLGETLWLPCRGQDMSGTT